MSFSDHFVIYIVDDFLDGKLMRGDQIKDAIVIKLKKSLSHLILIYLEKISSFI